MDEIENVITVRANKAIERSHRLDILDYKLPVSSLLSMPLFSACILSLIFVKLKRYFNLVQLYIYSTGIQK